MLTDDQIRAGKEARSLAIKADYLSGPNNKYDATVALTSLNKGGQTIGYAYEEVDSKVNLLVLVRTGMLENYYTMYGLVREDNIHWV